MTNYKITAQTDETLCIELYAKGNKKPVGHINIFHQDKNKLEGKVRLFTTLNSKHVEHIEDTL